MPTVARAALIDGSQLNISGGGIFSTTSVNWLCNQPGDTVCSAAPPNTGDFAVGASTGSFAQYNGTFGLIADLNNAVQPLNTPFSLPNFIIFDLNNDIAIELTFIPLGNDTLSTTCSGVSHCTPTSGLLVTPANPGGLSAYNLDSNASGTTLTFGVVGVVHQVGGGTGTLSGIYSASFTGLNAQETLAEMNSGAGATFSANFSLALSQTSIPEPASIFLSGIGLAGLGLVASRVRRS